MIGALRRPDRVQVGNAYTLSDMIKCIFPLTLPEIIIKHRARSKPLVYLYVIKKFNISETWIVSS